MAREEAHQMKMLISYGGSFKEATAWEKEQREKVRYAGGESKIISVDRGGIDLRSLLARISELIPGALLSVPADPPGLWLSHLLVWAAAGPDDAGGQILVPVLEDGDVARMTAEHDRLAALGRPARLRVFLCDSAPSPAWRLGEADVPATTMTNAFLGEGGYFSGLLSDDGVNVWKTGRAGEKKVRAGGPHLVGQAENKEPRGRTAGASRRCAPRPPPLPQPIKPVQARRKAASRAGNAAEWPGLVVKKGETQIPMHARKPAFLPTQQVLLKSEGIQALSTCFMQLLQREIDSRSSLTKHGRRTAALGGAYRLHTPLACSDSDALPPLDWTVERWTERTEEGRSRGEAVAQKADAKVQSESIEARGKLQPAFPQLATGQLQTIRSRDLEEIRELGSGSFGTVFHGKWKGSDVAIKRLKPSCFAGGGSVSDRLIAEFWKEAHLLAQLHHPNLVAFYGVVTDGRRTSLATVTEFMVNGSLKQVLGRKDRTIDRRKRLIIAMDAAFGMEYLHEKGVVHFDLKSHNFLVNMRDSHRPVCKIGDLGLSKVKRRTLVSGGVRGTIPWMAPELLNSHTNMVTEKVDVYSFGIVMWELLTGEEPYEYMSSEEVIAGIIRGDLRPEIPSWCEPNWRSLMERCWAGEPSSRPPFSAIAKELRAMAAGMNIL